MHITHLLSHFSKSAEDYAMHLYKHRDEISSTANAKPSVVDIALWGIEAEEWFAAQRAARLQIKSDNLSSLAPVIYFTNCEIDDSGNKLQLWGNKELRPGFIEDWMNSSLSPHDEQCLLEMLVNLPLSWSLVIDGRGTRS
ncbi:MAG: hypothetical protein IKE45_04025 [Halomonas sp.]|nr:hypothetical protein [Halomonas sp.]MBR2513186.1 hypothetical protein [Halomonas sp.]